jgi:TPP-dependent trihydroxycyclohexane-1,2-dione (THcHDO) dehydratase
METTRLTVAQGVLRFLTEQRTILAGQEASPSPGVFAIFRPGTGM